MAAMELTKKLDVIESHLSKADVKTFSITVNFSDAVELFKFQNIGRKNMEQRIDNTLDHIDNLIERLRRIKTVLASVKEQI